MKTIAFFEALYWVVRTNFDHSRLYLLFALITVRKIIRNIDNNNHNSLNWTHDEIRNAVRDTSACCSSGSSINIINNNSSMTRPCASGQCGWIGRGPDSQFFGVKGMSFATVITQQKVIAISTLSTNVG